MEILVYITLGLILGICIGNTSIRNKIGEEIHTIITKERPRKVDCPMKEPVRYKVSYVAKKPVESKTQGSESKPKSPTVCIECGNPIEIIDKMPGFFYCDNCKKVVSTKKSENARP